MYVIKLKEEDKFLHIYKETNWLKTGFHNQNTAEFKDLQKVRKYSSKQACSTSLNNYLNYCQKQVYLDINNMPLLTKEDLEIREMNITLK